MVDESYNYLGKQVAGVTPHSWSANCYIRHVTAVNTPSTYTKHVMVKGRGFESRPPMTFQIDVCIAVIITCGQCNIVRKPGYQYTNQEWPAVS